MKSYDHLYQGDWFKDYQLANGYISQTTIFFEDYHIYVEIEADGHIVYKDTSDSIISTYEIETPEDGKRKYTDIRCICRDGILGLYFPIVKWIDNYPNCDGEHDRWDTIKVAEIQVLHNLDTKEITQKYAKM